jgi:hypothetical protein
MRWVILAIVLLFGFGLFYFVLPDARRYFRLRNM